MNKQAQINAWRISQGLEPLTGSGKTARSKTKNARTASNQMTRAEYCRNLKDARHSSKR